MSAARTYAERHLKFAKAADAFEAQSRSIGNLRGASFLAIVVGLGAGVAGQGPLPWAIGGLGCAAFVVLVARHDRIEKREQAARRRAWVNERGERRVGGTWRTLPDDGRDLLPADHPYAEDLDLFGPGSLYQRLAVCHTRYGRRRLAELLSNMADVAEVRARQAAVRELCAELELRQSVEAEAMALTEKQSKAERAEGGPDPARLLAWVKAGPELPGGILLTLLSFVLPLAALAGAILHGAFDRSPAFWGVPLVLSLGLLFWARQATSEAFAAVSTTQGAFLRYGELFALLESYAAKSPWLAERLGRLGSGRASRVMKSFATRVSWFELRHNGMIYPFVNLALLWDIHSTRALLGWRREVSRELDDWFQILGDFEAISSLSVLAFEEPEATFPRVVGPDEDDRALAARALGHPLVAAPSRVTNDVDAFGPGQALLVTGSNMSGKSTFLRSLGTNLVLAFAGAPVIASEFRVGQCSLGTSIRISDSLSRGVSHFYAEVQKLARVVEASRGERPVFFLLDEVLHGTNSRERQIGARWVLGELLEHGAFGVVTTHDMELCRLPEPLMSRVRQHHFSEQVRQTGPAGEGEMTFDYTLRAGPVTSGNALRLMRTVGLGVPLDD